jgi:hypothetical protein
MIPFDLGVVARDDLDGCRWRRRIVAFHGDVRRRGGVRLVHRWIFGRWFGRAAATGADERKHERGGVTTGEGHGPLL